MNNSSRYDEMKNFIINDTEELLINLLNKKENEENQNISKESHWKTNLKLDRDYDKIKTLVAKDATLRFANG